MGCEATAHANHHFMQLSDKWNILLTLDIKLLLTAFTVMLIYKWLFHRIAALWKHAFSSNVLLGFSYRCSS